MLSVDVDNSMAVLCSMYGIHYTQLVQCCVLLYILNVEEGEGVGP